MSVSVVQDDPLELTPASPTRRIVVPSLAELYAEHSRFVWRCLRSLGVSDSELDDSIQDVFLVVQKRLAEFDGRVSPKTWLFAIAIRVARRYRERWRRAQITSTDDASSPALAAVPSAEVVVDQNQRLADARAALDALDDDKREVFVLAQVEQMSAPEIAQITGVPVNTVYSRLRAARSAFADALKRIEARHRRSR